MSDVPFSFTGITDRRLYVIDFELHYVEGAARPVGERQIAAILRLEKTHRIVREIEFDIDLFEEVVAEKEGNIVPIYVRRPPERSSCAAPPGPSLNSSSVTYSA